MNQVYLKKHYPTITNFADTSKVYRLGATTLDTLKGTLPARGCVLFVRLGDWEATSTKGVFIARSKEEPTFADSSLLYEWELSNHHL